MTKPTKQQMQEINEAISSSDGIYEAIQTCIDRLEASNPNIEEALKYDGQLDIRINVYWDDETKWDVDEPELKPETLDDFFPRL